MAGVGWSGEGCKGDVKEHGENREPGNADQKSHDLRNWEVDSVQSASPGELWEFVLERCLHFLCDCHVYTVCVID